MRKIILMFFLFIQILFAQSNPLLILMDDEAFSPLEVSGMVAWYNGDIQPSITSGAILTWADQFGSNDISTPDNAANHPDITNALNGHKTVLFDGTNDFMKGDFAINQPSTIYIVAKQITWTSDDTWWDGKVGDSMLLRQRGSTPELNIYAGTGWAADNTDLAVNTWGVIRVIYNGASSSIRVDDNVATTGNAGTSNSTGLALGGLYAGSYCANIEVAEIIIYTGAIVSADDILVMKYLNTKYGL